MSGNRTTQRSGKDLVILCVEDNLDTLKTMTEYVKEHYSPECRGVRSMDEAMDLVEYGFSPALVLHDCNPLHHPDDDRDSITAGDQLYRFLVENELPVAVLTGQSPEEMMRREPYRSDPPLCWLEKPLTRDDRYKEEIRWKQLDAAVEAYWQWRDGGDP